MPIQMNRRNFLAGLAALPIIPLIAPSKEKLQLSSIYGKMNGYSYPELQDVGMYYTPYLPLMVHNPRG